MSGTLLGFDVGTRWVGVAVGNALSGTRPLKTLRAEPTTELWRLLDGLISEWKPTQCVVGLPLALDGTEQAMTRRARAFATALEARGMRTVLIDERHSSQDAQHSFAQARANGSAKKSDAQNIDAWAAALILERYLAELA